MHALFSGTVFFHFVFGDLSAVEIYTPAFGCIFALLLPYSFLLETGLNPEKGQLALEMYSSAILWAH